MGASLAGCGVMGWRCSMWPMEQSGCLSARVWDDGLALMQRLLAS